ncbi:MAG TPA: hypothetical protein PLV68_05505, partial [Ilumatobacteraceae bacterium]|nr:hypothetical protein [Ilumatobacteraceae bacterium]
MTSPIDTSLLEPDDVVPNADQDPVLDNLVWHALTTTHARLAEGAGFARRYRPDVAGFVAIESRTPQAWSALAALVGPGVDVVLSGGH